MVGDKDNGELSSMGNDFEAGQLLWNQEIAIWTIWTRSCKELTWAHKNSLEFGEHTHVYVDRCYTCQVCGACVICCLAARSWVTQSMHNMQQQVIGRMASVVMFHPDIRYDVESRMEGNHILTGPTIGQNTTNYKLRTFQFNKKICWGVFLMYF